MKNLKELLFKECAAWESAYRCRRNVWGENDECAIAAEHKFQALYNVLEDADLDGEYAQWEKQNREEEDNGKIC